MWVWHFQVIAVVWLPVFCVSSSRFLEWYVCVALPGYGSRVAPCVLCLILAVPWVICECGTSRLLQSCGCLCSVPHPRGSVSDMWVWHFQVIVVVWLSVFCVSSSRFCEWYVSVALPGYCSRVAPCVLCLILAVPWVIFECSTSRLLQ